MPRQSRRMTLGPVNHHGTTEETPNKARGRPPKGRKSMIPRVGGENLIPPSPGPSAAITNFRRQSTTGVNPNRRQSLVPPSRLNRRMSRVDPRPTHDKKFQKESVKQLVEFLNDSGYGSHITTSMFPLSRKGFSNIVTFMLRKIDPTFQNGAMKFEDEVVMYFNAIGYPFTPSKTALAAAGAPHTWPDLLASLTWLMERIQILEADELASANEEQQDKAFASVEELQIKSDKDFFTYLSKSYAAFLDGDKARTELLETEFVDTFERDTLVIEQELERVSYINGQMAERMEHLGQEAQHLPELVKQREEYATELLQLEDLVKQMDEHKEALSQKVKDRTAELEKAHNEVDAMKRETAALKDTVQGQELSVEDVRKMENEQWRLKESTERFSAYRQNLKEQLSEAQIELANDVEKLESLVRAYNAKLSEFAMNTNDPDAAKFKITLKKEHLHSDDQTLLLGVDLADVRSYFATKKSDSEDELLRLRRELQQALDDFDASEEALTEATDKLKIVEDRKTKCEETLESEREQQEAALAIRLREVSALEDKIKSLRDPASLEEQIARFQRQCVRLQALRMQHEEENVARKKAVQEEIKAALKAVGDHNVYVRKKFAELQQYILTKQASLEKVQVPPGAKLDK